MTDTDIFTPKVCVSQGGGALTLERGMGMCHGHDPFFSGQLPLLSLPIYHQSVRRSCDPRFQFLEKFWIFSHDLAKILAL